jgi:hypothetical protein
LDRAPPNREGFFPAPDALDRSQWLSEGRGFVSRSRQWFEAGDGFGITGGLAKPNAVLE